MTIYQEFGHFDGLEVCIAGDLDHPCTAKSSMQNLETFGSNPHFTGPDEWRSAEFEDHGTFVTIDEVIEEVDVMMFLCVQRRTS